MANDTVIHIVKKDNGWDCDIKGPHKLGGELVFNNLDEIKMLERLAEVVTGFKCLVERR